jgi:ATP-binding cassette subfamily B protein
MSETSAPTRTFPPLPGRFAGALPGEDVLAWAPLDLAPDGRFDDALLALTERELVRLAADGAGACVAARTPLTELVGMTCRERDGWVALEGPAGVEVARASSAHLEALAAIREHAVTWRDEGVRPGAGGVPRACSTCGRPKSDRRCPHCRPWHRTAERLAGVLRPYARSFAFALALMVAGTALSLAPPYLVKVLMDDVLRAGAPGGLLAMVVVAMAAATLFGQAVGYARSALDSRLAGLLAHELRVDGYRALSRFSLKEVAHTSPGAIASTLNRDVDQMISLLTDHGMTVGWHALMILGISGVLAWMEPKLLFGVLLPAPVIVVLVYRVSKGGRPIVTRVWSEWRRLTDTLNDVLEGFRVVKAFGAEGAQAARLERASDAYRGWELAQGLHYMQNRPMLAVLTGLTTVAVWGWGGWQVQRGGLSVGSLVAFVAYLGMLYGHVQSLAHAAASVPRMLMACERYFELIDTVPSVAAPTAPVRLERVDGRIVLERVSFAYKPGRPVLHDIDLAIAPGEMIGLVGKSGAGKTTLINLIARFHDPTRGRVTLDGVDLRELDPGDLRGWIGVVLQSPFLFEGTVLENMRIGRPRASLNDVCRAADRAQAHDFIMALPDAYDTRLGTGGHTLSAGERQRLTIARALLADPRVLILDEATASVDTRTEKAIQDALGELVRGRTTIAIAHRLSTLGRADRLVVMDGGRIVDTGTHRELCARPGLYRDLVEAQEEMMRVSRMRSAAEVPA